MKPFLRHFLRIDPRSLGVFRIVFSLVLIRDLLSRWRWIDEFYSNEGVLPNHNHLYNLKSEGKSVWSALHAFSTGGEATFGFCVILLFYVLLLVGYRTRWFQAMALVSLVSLTARNLLLENPGNYVAIGLLAFTLFLPLGSRFGIDSLRATMANANDVNAADLNKRSRATDDDIDRHRAPGWSPVSIAALGLLLQIALVYLALALQQTGAWKDGSALHKALHFTRMASPFGFSMRDSGVLSLLTRVVYYSQWAIPLLIVIPVVRGPLRGLAAVLMAIHGIVLGLFFNLGLFGWSLAAASLLVISSDTWEKWATRYDARRARTVIYDADCGICFWICKLLKRLDTRHQLTFQANDDLERPKKGAEGELERVLLRVDPASGKVKAHKLPKSIDDKLVDRTVIAVDDAGNVATEGRAVGEIFLALPGFALVGRLLLLPGISSLANALYQVIAVRRTKLSTELGLVACGVPVVEPAKGRDKQRPLDPLSIEVPPARQLRFNATAAVRELLAAVVLAAALVQITHQNAMHFQVPQSASLSKVAWYLRLIERFDVLTPEPATTQSTMVIDAITQGDKPVDTLTGAPPYVGFDQPFKLGQLWADYLARIQDDSYKGYQQAFKTYVGKAGPNWTTKDPNDKIKGADVYWITGPTLPDGAAPEPDVKKMFRHAKGGTVVQNSGAAGKPDVPKLAPPRPTAPDGLDPVNPRILRNPEDRREDSP